MLAATIDSLMIDHQVLRRRSLHTELRPSRNDMLRMFSEGRKNLAMENVCVGQCIYCDSDDGGGDDA
jgi:hypothetical protein